MSNDNIARVSNDAQQKNLEALWGSGWQKLTPKQQELVAEIFSQQPQKIYSFSV